MDLLHRIPGAGAENQVARLTAAALLAAAAFSAHASDPAPLTRKELRDVVPAGKAALASRLKDPSSLQFRNLFVAQKQIDVDGRPGFTPVLCGEFNAKNSYGGYVGFKHFMATAGYATMADEDETIFMQTFWAKWCDRKVADVK